MTGSRDLFLRIMAVLLLLTGAVMLFTELSAELAFALIAIGAALPSHSMSIVGTEPPLELAAKRPTRSSRREIETSRSRWESYGSRWSN